MPPIRLAAWLDSYGVGLRTALETAARQGYRTVQASAIAGELRPREFSRSGRRHLRKFLKDLGLQLDACAANYPGAGLCDSAHADQRLAEFRDTLALCADLGAPRAGVTLGSLAAADETPLAREMLANVAEMASHFGITTAIHDQASPLPAAADEVRRLGCEHLRVAFDAAQSVADPVDPALGADTLGTIYLRDVRRQGDAFEEVPYGRGEVDLRTLATLPDVISGHAALVLRRDPTAGVDALRQGREYILNFSDRA